MVHGSPRDEDERLNDLIVSEAAAEAKGALTFFEHSHVQGGYAVRGGTVRRVGRQPESLHNVTLNVEPGWHYLVSRGSVGQRRDGDPRAAFALYDPDECTIQFRRVVYDVGSAQCKIRAQSLPDFLADRLATASSPLQSLVSQPRTEVRATDRIEVTPLVPELKFQPSYT